MKASEKVTVSAMLITAQETTKFLRTHTPGTTCYLVGKGAQANGFCGACQVEDLLRIVANPNPTHANREYVSIKLTAPPQPDGDLMAAMCEIAAEAQRLEKEHVRGFAVVGDQLLSVPCGMVAGLVYHEFSKSKRQPHGHLLVFPQVVSKGQRGEADFHQLDAASLLKGIIG